jgi:hypothetical protein
MVNAHTAASSLRSANQVREIVLGRPAAERAPAAVSMTGAQQNEMLRALSRSDLERMFYGFSILHCLPVGMVDKPSKETGTVMRPGTFRAYAAEAGFQKVEILPVDNESFYFYRLTA